MRFRHPEWDRSCAACEQWWWRSDGTLVRTPGGDPIPRRNPEQPTPCASCPKVPAYLKAAGKPWKELRKAADDMTAANRQAVRYYLECVATGMFPNCPVVRWYAGVIRDEEDRFTREQQRDQTAALEVIMLSIARRKR